ncbi:MAG: hypothetical protein NVSMB57_02910 [Actinomycetota bacterium]
MSTLLVGCAGFPVEPTEYATQLNFVEIQESFHEGKPLDEMIRTIRRVAGDLSLGLVASKVITHPRKDSSYKIPGPDVPEHAAVGHFTRSRWTDEAWERTDVLVRSLKAKVVLLRTPPSFKKNAANALALENFVAHAERPGLDIAWDFSSAWSEADAMPICERLGLVPVVDANAKTFPAGDLYVRYQGGTTGRTSPSEAAIGTLAQKLKDRTGFAVFGNNARWEDARRLAKAL